MHLIPFLLVGLVAGWLSGLFMKGRGFGFFGDILIGILGAFVGSFIFGALGLEAYGFIANVLMAVVGAVALLALARLLSGKKKG